MEDHIIDGFKCGRRTASRPRLPLFGSLVRTIFYDYYYYYNYYYYHHFIY